MTTTPNTPEQSDIDKAIDKVAPADIVQNVADNNDVGEPEPLTKQQDTPFIDKDVRTDANDKD